MAKLPNTAEPVLPDPEKMNPQTTPEFQERGWLFYSNKSYESAEADFRFILQREPENVDAIYALGLTLKAEGKSQQALDAFNRIDDALGRIEDHQRAVMVARLAHGQINQLRTGDWNLEKEVWKSKR